MHAWLYDYIIISCLLCAYIALYYMLHATYPILHTFCSVPNKGLAFVRLPDVPAAQRAVYDLTGSVLAEEYTLEMATADTEMQ